MAEQQPNWWQVKNHDQLSSKMTKREMIAAMAMQGLMANSTSKYGGSATDSVAHIAVKYADELLKALEKTK